jgi:hypothetical protein
MMDGWRHDGTVSIRGQSDSPAIPSAVPAKRIGVLTFHRCINYGSYWQARALVEGLRAEGHDAVLLEHQSPRVRWAEWRCAFQPLLPERSPRADFPLYAGKARKLLEAVDRLPRSAPFALDRPEEMEDFDLVLVGSDEVWNLRHPWYGRDPIFWGAGVTAPRLVSYAASFGNHDAADGLDPERVERLRRFDAISVRDENSRSLLRAAAGIEAELVLDPCLQFAPSATPAPPDRDGRPYVAVYGHSFPAWYAEAVRAWAGRMGLRLVSIGYRNRWADEQAIDAGPEDFARWIANAAAVVTNFFHGCVFALRHARPFACASSAYRSNKVRDLMRAVGADHRLAREGDDAGRLGRLLETPLEQAVSDRIETLRLSSEAYLARALA